MVRVDARGEGSIATRSGYVRIQGRQDDVALWPHAFVMPTEKEPLPGEIAGALAIEPGRDQIGGLGEWNLGYWVAAADQRAGLLANLNDGHGSTAHRRGERNADVGRSRRPGTGVRPARPRTRGSRRVRRASRTIATGSFRSPPRSRRHRAHVGHRPGRPSSGDRARRPVTIAGVTGSLEL
jgi:hypothetical protein